MKKSFWERSEDQAFLSGSWVQPRRIFLASKRADFSISG